MELLQKLPSNRRLKQSYPPSLPHFFTTSSHTLLPPPKPLLKINMANRSEVLNTISGGGRNTTLPQTLTLDHVSPATRLLEKRRQMFEVQVSLLSFLSFARSSLAPTTQHNSTQHNSTQLTQQQKTLGSTRRPEGRVRTPRRRIPAARGGLEKEGFGAPGEFDQVQ